MHEKRYYEQHKALFGAFLPIVSSSITRMKGHGQGISNSLVKAFFVC